MRMPSRISDFIGCMGRSALTEFACHGSHDSTGLASTSRSLNALPGQTMYANAAIIGVGQSAYTRRPEPGQSTVTFIRDAVVAALKDAAIDARDVDGLAV